MAVRVKICGITSREDALAAAEAGADALGFIFFQGSPRWIEPDQAASVISIVPPFLARVGVFVNEPVEKIIETTRRTGIDTVQLHGDETPADCEKLRETGLKVVKAFRVRDRSSLAAVREYPANAVLLDSYVPGQLGGTGAVFNWELAIEAKQFGRPVILAGGLTPENIADAVMKVRPYGVDVSSGVESAPGKKDLGKVRDFIAAAKRG